jgi:hypothetical protein
MAKRTYNRRGRQTAKTPVTSSKRRPQRIKGAQTARRTGSKDKMTVSGQRNIKGGPRGAQGPANPPQQGPSRRTPTAMGGDTGRRGGPNQPSRSGPPRPAGPKAGRIGSIGSQMRTAASLGTLVNPRSDVPAKVVAAASIVSDLLKNTSKGGSKKGTGKPMASMGKDYKAKEKEAGRKAIASNFDQAFAAARRAGKKEFTWRGKRYNTKMK